MLVRPARNDRAEDRSGGRHARERAFPLPRDGGTGSVGYRPWPVVLAEGASVAVLDDLSTGSIDNIAHLPARARVPLRRVRLGARRGLLAELVDLADVVVHLAAAVGVRLIVESPSGPSRRTSAAPRSCSSWREEAEARAHHVTSEVYGKSNRSSLPRGRRPASSGRRRKGRWSYACSKAIDEFLALAYWRERGLPDRHRAALQHRRPAPDRPLRHGDADASCARRSRASRSRSSATARRSRCFTHVRDVVGALIALARAATPWARSSTSAATRRSRSSSWRGAVAELTAIASEIVLVPYEQAYEDGFEDMMRRVPDLDEAPRAHRLRADRTTCDGILDSVIAEAWRRVARPRPRPAVPPPGERRSACSPL